jgi:hypothetical protein
MHQLRQSALWVAVATVLAVGAAACGVDKSENPTSPSVAGPIAGVSITTPALVEPAANKQFAVSELPVKLTIQNSTTNGQRPVSYTFEVATDSAFTSKILTKSGIQPGANGQTTLILVDVPLEAGKTYYWRAWADDGANQSKPADARAFSVYQLTISVPNLISPTEGQQIIDPPVTFAVQNSTTNGQRPLVYIFDIAADAGFSSIVYTTGPAGVPQGGDGQTKVAVDKPLELGKSYYWRAKATDGVGQSAYAAARKFSISNGASTPTPPSPQPSGNDAIDLRTVTWAKGVNASTWAVTSTMISVTYDAASETLCTYHTMQGKWPALPYFDSGATVEGNQVVLAKIDGKWYAGSGEWLRPGQACKRVPPVFGPDTFWDSPPLSSWTPRPGEQVGFMVTTPSRAGQWGTAERSNVILITWR